MFRSYLRLALFALGLLVGVQVPGLSTTTVSASKPIALSRNWASRAFVKRLGAFSKAIWWRWLAITRPAPTQ